ncbi:hypothetical protein [Streptomyces sp. NPDC088733]
MLVIPVVVIIAVVRLTRRKSQPQPNAAAWQQHQQGHNPTASQERQQ